MESQQKLLDSIERRLSSEVARDLDSELTTEEFAFAIKKLKPHSAPGPDGFSSDFFRLDRDVFGEILAIVFGYQLERGILLPHQRYSSVALLFKKGDRSELGNFRPITLMPVEVKILSRVLVNRLRPHIAKLVHPDQKGFIPGRRIDQQIMLARDLHHLETSLKRIGLVTFLDFAKAYDRVNRPYLLRVLERQGFGLRFLAWIRLLYSDSKCSLMINGWAQDSLTPTRRVKQGDPLSPYLFALSLEPLGNLLRARRDLGVLVDQTLRVPVGFFADDTVLFSKGKRELEEQLRIVDNYCGGSGTPLNHNKSVIMSLNSKRPAPRVPPLKSLERGETMRYLGIPFGNCDTSTLVANQLDKKLLKRLQLWKGRARTLIGRRLIAQAEILSLLWYFTASVTIPTRFIKRWQGIVNRYVLYIRVSAGKSGISIVQKGLAMRPREADGIGVPDVATIIRRQHFQLLQKFVLAITTHPEEDENVWYRPMLYMIQLRYGNFARPRSSDFLLQNPPKPAGWRSSMLPLWWRRLLREWNRVKCPAPESIHYSRMKTLQKVLFTPIWWSILPELQVLNTRSPASPEKPLGSGSNTFRALCRELAKHKKIYFADFLDINRCWPSSTAFFTDVCSEIHPIIGTKVLPEDIFVLYHQMSRLFHRLLPHPEAGGMQEVGNTNSPPIFGIKLSGSLATGPTARFFPNLRSQDWNVVLQQVPDLMHHPMEDLGCPRQRIHETLSRVISLRGYLLPVIHDVMLRMCFGDLIVGSRLYFLRELNPTIQNCVRPECQAIETVEHCFVTCPSLEPMWRELWSRWSRFFCVDLSWRLLLFSRLQDLRRNWRSEQKELILLWRVNTAIVFHATWRLRNDIHFQETVTEVPNIPNLLNSFKMHYQYLYQHAQELHCNRSTVVCMLQKLGFDPPENNIPEPMQHMWTTRT